MLPAWLTDTVTSDLDRALHYTLLWGLEGLELRTVGGPSSRVPFVNEEKLRRRLTDHDVPAVAVVPGMFEGMVEEQAVWRNEVAQFAETLGFCRRIGCGQVVISAFGASAAYERAGVVEALQRVGEAAARHRIVVAVLNETGMAHATGAMLAELLAQVDHPAVGAAWDPGAAVQAGEDPQVGLQAVAERVELVRCYNVAEHNGAWTTASLGEGVVDWPAQLRIVQARGFAGPVSLVMPRGSPARQGLRMAGDLIRMMRTVTRG